MKVNVIAELLFDKIERLEKENQSYKNYERMWRKLEFELDENKEIDIDSQCAFRVLYRMEELENKVECNDCTCLEKCESELMDLKNEGDGN